MNMLAEAEIREYLKNVMRYNPFEAGTILFALRNLAHSAGHELDERLARAGLAAGPEGRIASSIVSRALGMGGCDTSMYTIRLHTDGWLQTTSRKGAVA